MSAASSAELTAVIARSHPPLTDAAYQLLESAFILLVSLSVEQGMVAPAAYASLGRGSGYPARLNVGDCFVYARALGTGQPMIFALLA